MAFCNFICFYYSTITVKINQFSICRKEKNSNNNNNKLEVVFHRSVKSREEKNRKSNKLLTSTRGFHYFDGRFLLCVVVSPTISDMDRILACNAVCVFYLDEFHAYTLNAWCATIPRKTFMMAHGDTKVSFVRETV